MAKKRQSPNIPNAITESEAAYVKYDSNDKGSVTHAFAALDKAVETYCGRVNAHSRMGFSPTDAGGSGVSGRYGLTHQDYESWRPNESTHFKNSKEAMLYADLCYQRHGLIKNVIDLMGDFASQGIRLVHPNKRIEKFFQNWFRKVRGVQVTERFENYLYRLSNVVVRSQTAKISPTAKEKLFKARATPDMVLEDLDITKNEIPIKYTFLHPASIDVVGDALANFVGRPQYVLNVPRSLNKIIKAPKNAAQQELVAMLPTDIKTAIESSKPVLLPKDKTKVYHYKKDDWQAWANPIISSLALDISLYEKLKLADRAALDGAISNIRVFKLGNLEHQIVPTDKAAAKLASILESNTEAGTLDLIWGPDLEIWESSTNVHQFLGQSKYEPTLISLYAGLGIPPTLTGTFGAAGTTNNFISLKTMTQRLQYGRDVVTAFWDEQIRIVQEAMGFRFPARVEFDLMNLGDEVAEKALLVQLADRNLISDELLQHYFGSDPEMERIRTNNEFKERERDARADKAGPFYDPQVEEGLRKTALQTGIVTPSELGIELEERKKGEKPALDMKQPVGGPGGKPASKKKGQPGQGRPKTVKDSTPRTKKRFVPKTKASLIVWADSAQDAISNLINPALLDKFGAKNMRGLTTEQAAMAEQIKFSVLCHLDPLKPINLDIVQQAVSKTLPKDIVSVYDTLEKQVSQDTKEALSVNARKHLRSYFYSTLYEEYNG